MCKTSHESYGPTDFQTFGSSETRPTRINGEVTKYVVYPLHTRVSDVGEPKRHLFLYFLPRMHRCYNLG